MNTDSIEATIRSAITLGDTILLRECAYAMKADISSAGSVSEQRFNFLIGLLDDQEFLNLGGSWCFIIVLGRNEAFLPDDQKPRWLPAIRLAHDAFYEMNPELITEAIYQAISCGSATQMRECCDAISLSISPSGPFPEHYFALFLKLMKQQEFLELEHGYGASALLHILEFEWELLSDSQKERLLPALETSYAAFTDWMCWFDISVLLGEFFADERALQVLCRLKTIQAEGPRSLVPHGLEHIISDSGDDRLAKKAYAELLAMKNDPSEEVRDAVDDSLRIVAKFVIKYENCP